MLVAVRKVDMISDALRVLLRDAVLPPHEALSSRDLADLYEVSRTPIRESLKQLQSEGLLVYLPQQGYYPRVPTDDEFEQGYIDRPEIAARSLERPEGARRPRRSNTDRSATFRELARLEEKATADTPARLVEAVLLDVASHATDPRCVIDARNNVAVLAHLREAEQILSGHASTAARIVRLYRDAKYDELLRLLREYSEARRQAVPHLSRQIARPTFRIRPKRR